MIKIAVVDDDKAMLKMIDRCLREQITLEDNIEILYFTGGENFLKEMKKGYQANILFCDIELKEMSGIEVGKIVRQKYPALYLVYLTSHSEFAIESYMLDAYQYILKEHMRERLPKILRQMLDNLKKENMEYKMIGPSTNKEKVYYSEIISICKEKGSKYVTYITSSQIYRERTTLEIVLKTLQSNDFVLIGRSLVINMRHIVRLTSNVVYLDNKVQIDIGKANMIKVKEKINRYWRGKL